VNFRTFQTRFEVYSFQLNGDSRFQKEFFERVAPKKQGPYFRILYFGGPSK
jgi:hypothetical protein